MDNECNIKYCDKKFANAAIEWKIENFCFAICSEKGCVYSPEFCLKGAHVTKWRMVLEVDETKGTDGCISFYLERLSDSGPDIVWADWETILKAGKKLYEPTGTSFFFEKNSKGRVILKSIMNVLEHLLPFEPDTLTIECNLIVRNKDMSVKLNKPVTVGLNCLSDDLKKLFHQTKYQDITIKVGSNEIKAHKVILSRNKIFKCMLDKNPGNILEIRNFDYDTLYKFIAFLYSGDMEDIMGNPSISMFKCVEYFNCDVFLCYYAPEKLNMNTRVVVEEHNLHWSINGFSNRKEDVISSPSFKGLNADSTWKVYFRPISTNDSTYNSIIAKLVEGHKPPLFSLEFAVEDLYGQTYFPKRILGFNNCYEPEQFEDFTKLDNLEGSVLLKNDTLNILFRVRTSAGEQVSSLGTRLMSFVTYTEDLSYKELASNMTELLRESKYADVIIQAEEVKFKAHRCILSIRSQQLARIINRVPPTDVVFLYNIKPNTLNMLLDYIYCGVLKDCEIDDLLELYAASGFYAMPSLKKECSRMLFSKVTRENLDIVFNAAKAVNDKELMNYIQSRV